MSYCASVSFKKIKEETVHSFFQQLKMKCLKNMDAYAKECWSYCPLCKKIDITKDITEETFFSLMCDDNVEFERARLWFYRVFAYRWTFLPEHNMVAVFGVPDFLRECFDGTVCFQNSCDRDYELSEYDGISLFEKIWHSWQDKPKKEIIEISIERYGYSPKELENNETLNYLRRVLAYDEIFDFVSDTLFNDDSALYISLFHNYDILYEKRFLYKCLKHAKKELI